MGYETAKAQRRAEPGVAYPLVVVGRLVVLGEVQAYVLGLFVDAQTDQLVDQLGGVGRGASKSQPGILPP